MYVTALVDEFSVSSGVSLNECFCL
jgi:hypothetical protein